MSAGDQTRMCFIGPGSDAKAAALIDVVFVHGLGGDYASTWAPDGAVDCWLDWLVEDIPGIRRLVHSIPGRGDQMGGKR